VVQKLWYEDGETFAHTSAATTAQRRKTAPPVSVFR
jgi:hypothetical protein